MPILIKKAVEPGSPAAVQLPPILAGSTASQSLHRILRRYVEGNVSGRSFLISGHRGAGKTTIVKKVVDEVTREFAARPLRPLLVSLSGPMLLPPNDTSTSIDETKLVLEQLALNLYRQLARHFADCYALHMRAAGPFDTRHDVVRRMEIADDFRQKLDSPMELAELRAFWEYAGALEQGVLFSHPAVPADGQGSREIVGLWSCLSAYLSLAATDYSLSAGDTESAGLKAEVSAKSPADKGILAALLSVGSGGAVGAGLVAAGQTTALATLGGLVTAVAAAVILNFSASRSRESARTLQSKIDIKRDMQSLARELPELLRRCRDAGIVPVFLIDELDKVERLEKRMQSLIYSTKLLVTEQSLFFFVTDRAYYEYIEQLCRDVAYPREHTFFSERVFVSYQPGDWRSYIRELLIPGATDQAAQQLEADAIDILSFVLMCRSRMHAIDLRRSINIIAEIPATAVREDVESVIRIEPGDLIKQRRFLFEVLIQVAVEVTLAADPDFSGRCALEPPFTQVAYDALYYLPRAWEKNPQEPPPLQEDQFRDWLNSRSETLVQEDNANTITFLLRKVNEVSYWLRNPRELADYQVTKQMFKPKVLEMVQATPALLATNAQSQYEWLFDIYGRALHPETVERVLENQQLAHDRVMLREVNDFVREHSCKWTNLASLQKLGLLPATPPSTAVFEGIERLENLTANPVAYSQMDEDVQNVTIFAETLRNGSEGIARLIVSAWLLARCSPLTDEAARIGAAWGCLSDRLYSPDANANQCADFMRKIFYRVQGHYTTQDHPYLTVVSMRQEGHDAWRKSIDAAVVRIKGEKFEEEKFEDIEARAWEGWQLTFLNYLQGHPFAYGMMTDYTLEELMAGTRGQIAARWLKPELSLVPISAWSTVIFEALNFTPKGRGAPLWAAHVGFIRTGFETTGIDLSQLAAEPERTAFLNFIRQSRILPAKEPSPPFPRTLILRSEEKSLITNWLVESGYPCLILTRAQRSAIAPTLSSLQFSVILIEPEVTETVENLASQFPLNLCGSLSIFEYVPNLTQVAVLSSQPLGLPSTNTPIISVPLGVKDAVTRLQSMSPLSPSSPSSQPPPPTPPPSLHAA